MINSLLDIILRNKQIIPIVVTVASIGIYMAPTNAFAFTLGGSGTGSIPGVAGLVGVPDSSSHTDVQALGQSNSITATNTGAGGTVSASGNNQTNIGINAAHIGVGASGTG